MCLGMTVLSWGLDGIILLEKKYWISVKHM